MRPLELGPAERLQSSDTYVPNRAGHNSWILPLTAERVGLSSSQAGKVSRGHSVVCLTRSWEGVGRPRGNQVYKVLQHFSAAGSGSFELRVLVTTCVGAH